jgi:hypothetical protein
VPSHGNADPAEEDDLWQRFHRAVNMASAKRDLTDEDLAVMRKVLDVGRDPLRGTVDVAGRLDSR